MSKGPYTIIDSYVGKQEAYLTASINLKQRLEKLREYNLDNTEWSDHADTMPTFSDINRTHMFYVKRSFKPFVAFGYEYYRSAVEVGTSTQLPRPNEDAELRFNLRANNGDFIHDQVIKVVFEAKGNPNASASAMRYRYCDYPGIRMFKEIRLSVDKDDIDVYTPEDVLFYMENRLSEDKRRAWEKLLGQQETLQGTYYHEDRNIDEVRFFKDGAQTFKPYQPPLELWIPLIFDHNRDVGRSLHNKIIGSQQIYVELVLNSVDKIIQVVDSNNKIIPNMTINLAIKEFALFTKNIYLNPEINDLFSERNNLSIIRVHRRHVVGLGSPNTNILLSSLKYPIESIHFGFRPNINNNIRTNPYHNFTDWHQMSVVTRSCVPLPALISKPTDKDPKLQQLVVRTARYLKQSDTVNTVSFSLFGNQLYPHISGMFFGYYQPYIIPGMVSRRKCGYYTVSFSHYPTIFSPAGHINNSTAREFFIGYASDFISGTNPTTLYASAQCINFLMYKSGSIKLKYIA